MGSHLLGSEHADQPHHREDALSLLSADHQQITELFDLFEEALENESSEQQLLADQICGELEIHSQLEEEIFYPFIAQDISIEPLVESAIKAHSEIKTIIQMVRKLEPNDDDLGVLMLQLMEQVEEHIDEEENIMFAEVEKHLGDELETLGLHLEIRKKELLASPQEPQSDSTSSMGSIR